MKIQHDTPEAPLMPLIQDGSGRRITVLLTSFPSGEVRNFRCTNCGKIAFKYQSEIQNIIDRDCVPEDKAPIENICHRCKITYLVLW